MPQANVIRWKDGRGWIVLSGGGDITSSDTGDIEGGAMEYATAGRPIAYIWAAGDVDAADKHLAALEDLGGPTGFLVDVLTEDDDTLHQQLTDAGLIILGDGPDLKKLRSGLLGAASEAILSAYDQQTVILGVGAGAAALGALTTDQPGLGWIENAVIVPHYDQADQPNKLRDVLKQHPDAYGIGIGTGSALALGPEGQVEAWGKGEITIILGRNFT